MPNEEEGLHETKLKLCDFVELSDNAHKAHYCHLLIVKLIVKLIGRVDPYSFPLGSMTQEIDIMTCLCPYGYSMTQHHSGEYDCTHIISQTRTCVTITKVTSNECHSNHK